MGGYQALDDFGGHSLCVQAVEFPLSLPGETDS